MTNHALAALLAALLAPCAEAATPSTMTYQGRLREANLPVTGTRQVNIFLCDSLTGGSCTGTGERPVEVANSLFKTTFTVPTSINLEEGSWYLEVRLGVGGATVLAPREQLTASPYAIVAATATTVLDGSITTAKIANGAVNSMKLADNAVATAHLNAGAVTSAKLADGSVASAKIADGGIVSGKLASGAVLSANILDGAVSSAKLSDGAVTSAKLADGSVASGKIADGGVVSGKLAAGAVASANISDGAVTSAKLSDGAVSSGKLGANAVATANIQDGVVTSGKIADGAVSSGKILDGGVASGKLAVDSVVTVNLQDGVVVTAKLAGGAVTTAKLAPEAFGPWHFLGRQKLSVGSGSIAINVPTVSYYKAIAYVQGKPGGASTALRFNGDTGSSYAYSYILNNNAPVTNSGVSAMDLVASGTTKEYLSFEIVGAPGGLVIVSGIGTRDTGGGGVPDVVSYSGTYSSVSGVTSVELYGGGQNFQPSSELIVYGRD